MHKLGKNKLRACQMKKRRTDALPRCLKIVKHADQEGGFRLIRREVSMRPRPQKSLRRDSTRSPASWNPALNRYILNGSVKGPDVFLFRSRALRLILVGFLLGVLAFWYLQGVGSISNIFSSSSSRYGSGYDAGYNGYGGYGGNGGYGGYGGGAPYRNWGQPAYAVSAPYPRQIRRPPPPPPCYSPCDY